MQSSLQPRAGSAPQPLAPDTNTLDDSQTLLDKFLKDELARGPVMRTKEYTNGWCAGLAGAVDVTGDFVDQQGRAVMIALVRRILRGLN